MLYVTGRMQARLLTDIERVRITGKREVERNERNGFELMISVKVNEEKPHLK